MTEEKKQLITDNVKSILVQLIVTLGVVLGFYFTFVKETKVIEQATGQTTLNDLRALYNTVIIRLDKAEARNDSMTIANATKQMHIVNLKIELEQLKLSNIINKLYDNQTPYAKWNKTLGGVVTGINDVGLEWFFKSRGYSRGDVINKPDSCCWDKADWEQFRKEDLEAIRTGRVIFSSDPVNINGVQVGLFTFRYVVKKEGIATELRGAAFKVDFEEMKKIFNDDTN